MTPNHANRGKLARFTSKLTSTLKKVNPINLTRGLKDETAVNKQLHADVLATLKRMKEKDPGLAKAIDKAYGYAVLPAVGKATLVLGGTYGKGEVFKEGSLAGYCGLGQFTLGVQVGGQTFSELVLIQNKATFDHFIHAGLGFAANASAVIVKGGGAATNNYKDGLQIYVDAEGGLMLELAIGLQKLAFRPAERTRGQRGDVDPEVPAWLTEAGGEEAEGEEAEAGEGGGRRSSGIPRSVWRRALRNAGRASQRQAAGRPNGSRTRSEPRAAAQPDAASDRSAGAKRRKAPAAAARQARAPAHARPDEKTSTQKRRGPASRQDKSRSSRAGMPRR